MSAHQFRQNDQQLPQPPHIQHSEDDDYKIPYDDFSDDHSVPYAPNANHQTFTVLTSQQTSHRRGNSTPLKNIPFASKQSEETFESLPTSSYPPQRPAKEVDTRTLWEKILPESLACRLYIATVLVETTIDLAIEGELFLRTRELTIDSEDGTTRRMPVYFAIFALAHVFQFVMALDAVYARNTLQFISLAIFNALFLLYAIIQIKEIRDATANILIEGGISRVPINVLTTIIPIVISIAEIAYIALGWKIYHEFGWKVYKFLGADRRIKKMYANYQVYECLVKFDVFFWVGFCVQFIWLVLQENDWEYYVTCAALPLSIVLLVEGHLAARYENKWMMATFMCGCVGAMIYFIYKLIRVLLNPGGDQFKLVWKSLTVFSVIAIALLIATFVFSVIILRNFGRGLKDAFVRKAQQTKVPAHQRVASRTLNRMSIN
ncbi:hypothetical protein FA15DRAFT_600207 [Coprinopsis marcescibilis]|uniref:Uncharacterized protein n=1 Tax=Coprinopsis marcescibilis TaxID=230819 RepID=A0A5C3KJ13_COPMA|nr:hypothetical protein FA15DRAFT_600207 [Coprinopsis marcescibilis]